MTVREREVPIQILERPEANIFSMYDTREDERYGGNCKEVVHR